MLVIYYLISPLIFILYLILGVIRPVWDIPYRAFEGTTRWLRRRRKSRDSVRIHPQGGEHLPPPRFVSDHPVKETLFAKSYKRKRRGHRGGRKHHKKGNSNGFQKPDHHD